MQHCPHCQSQDLFRSQHRAYCPECNSWTDHENEPDESSQPRLNNVDASPPDTKRRLASPPAEDAQVTKNM